MPADNYTHACLNGEPSENYAWWAKDGRGIPLCKVCDDCEATKLKAYRPEILGWYTQNDVDENIEPDY